MLNVLIPMAGSGKRFKDAGYQLPKPLIDVGGRNMVERAVDPIIKGLDRVDHRLIFVVRDFADPAPYLPLVYNVTVVVTPPTDGAARTCLVARDLITTDDPLLIANCDQIVHPDSVKALISTDADAAVLTMPGDGSKKWSYAKVVDGEVIAVKEKNPISDRATCGLYWWHKGADFTALADLMIFRDDRVNGEFYVAPVIDYMIRENGCVREVRIEDHGNVFHGLGTPEDLRKYLASLEMGTI